MNSENLEKRVFQSHSFRVICVFAVLPEEIDAMEISSNPLEDVTAGLLDSAGQQLPLQAVHVKCKLIDLLSQVREGIHDL